MACFFAGAKKTARQLVFFTLKGSRGTFPVEWEKATRTVDFFNGLWMQLTCCKYTMLVLASISILSRNPSFQDSRFLKRTMVEKTGYLFRKGKHGEKLSQEVLSGSCVRKIGPLSVLASGSLVVC